MTPDDEVKDDSSNLFYNLCGYNIHCLASALVVTIILVFILIIAIVVVFIYRKNIFPCLNENDHWKASTLDLNDISNYLLQNNARVSAKFVGKGAEVHITSVQSEENTEGN